MTTVRIRTRGALDSAGLLTWSVRRQLPGVDRVDDLDGVPRAYTVAVDLPHGPGTVTLAADEGAGPGTPGARVDLDLPRPEDEGPALDAARRLWDLDADLPVIESHLSTVPEFADLVRGRPGVRIPGIPTVTEALLRAITGQQVSVESGRTQLVRLVEAVRADTAPHATGACDLAPFPTAAEALRALDTWYRGPRARKQTLADALELLSTPPPSGDSATRLEELAQIRGIGPWTLAYIRLRAFGDPDVDLSGDAALLTSARRLTSAQSWPHRRVTSRTELAALLDDAHPYRSYAALHLWAAD